MATDLAAQLQLVAARAGVDTKRSKGQASLLYDSRAASDLGAAQIYDIASQGAASLLRPIVYCFSPVNSAAHSWNIISALVAALKGKCIRALAHNIH